jgi:dephospho-CoA kinase
MPLVVLTGQPASGKSTAAARLRQLLEPHGAVTVVDEPSQHLERNTAYASEGAAAPGAGGACLQRLCRPRVA